MKITVEEVDMKVVRSVLMPIEKKTEVENEAKNGGGCIGCNMNIHASIHLCASIFNFPLTHYLINSNSLYLGRVHISLSTMSSSLSMW